MTHGTITISGQDYDVALDGDTVRIASTNGAGELVETLPIARLGHKAREALERGDFEDSALEVAVEGVTRAMADRGA